MPYNLFLAKAIINAGNVIKYPQLLGVERDDNVDAEKLVCLLYGIEKWCQWY